MDKQLRIMAANIVVESKLSKAAKLQMLNFIKEDATDAQIKALLMDGRIVQLDEQAEEIVNERFAASDVSNILVQEGTMKTILGMILLSPPGWIIYRSLKAMAAERQRRCGVLAIGKARDACLVAADLEIGKRTIALLKSSVKNCAKSPDPDKCKAKIASEIKKHEAKMAKAKAKLGKYSATNQASAKEKAKKPETKVI